MTKITLTSPRETHQLCLQAYMSTPPQTLLAQEGIDWLRDFSLLSLRPEDIRFFDLREKDLKKRFRGSYWSPGDPVIFLFSGLECYTLPLPHPPGDPVALAL